MNDKYIVLKNDKYIVLKLPKELLSSKDEFILRHVLRNCEEQKCLKLIESDKPKDKAALDIYRYKFVPPPYVLRRNNENTYCK